MNTLTRVTPDLLTKNKQTSPAAHTRQEGPGRAEIDHRIMEYAEVEWTHQTTPTIPPWA